MLAVAPVEREDADGTRHGDAAGAQDPGGRSTKARPSAEATPGIDAILARTCSSVRRRGLFAGLGTRLSRLETRARGRRDSADTARGARAR